MVAPANSTLAFIQTKVRRLTASSSESSLTTNSLNEYINNFYSQDFPYAIKLDQTRSVYTIFTSPNVDRYPLDINANQGIRDPVYFEGIKGFFFKDRGQFYNMWPRWPTKLQPISGDGTTTSFSFNLGITPILPTMVVFGGTDTSGATIRIVDDGGTLSGNGNFGTIGSLLLITSDTVGDITPPLPPTSPIQTLPPGPPYQNIGQVNYVTGACTINFPVAPASGTIVTAWVSQYSSGRPYSILFWNNEFQVRPVPDNVYKIELETYLTPTQFMANTDNPVIKQWAQYIAYGAACEILRDRQDFEGLSNLMEGFKRQEALVLERQGIEEINTRNTSIYASVVEGQNFGSPQGWY